MEKVIHEVRFVETDDGFRVEIKGDKEQIRKMGFGPGMGFMRHLRRGRQHGFGHGFGCCCSDEPEGAADKSSE